MVKSRTWSNKARSARESEKEKIGGLNQDRENIEGRAATSGTVERSS